MAGSTSGGCLDASTERQTAGCLGAGSGLQHGCGAAGTLPLQAALGLPPWGPFQGPPLQARCAAIGRQPRCVTAQLRPDQAPRCRRPAGAPCAPPGGWRPVLQPAQMLALGRCPRRERAWLGWRAAGPLGSPQWPSLHRDRLAECMPRCHVQCTLAHAHVALYRTSAHVLSLLEAPC